MNLIDISRRKLGINFNSSKVAEIEVWAPLAREVAVSFPEKDLKLNLQKDEYGYWKGSSQEIKPGWQYKFIINNEKERPDPASLAQPFGVHGYSQVIDHQEYPWENDNWKNLPLEDYLIYELHTGTFTPEGTFHGIEEKLDYLKELGINAIEIMPVAQFPGSRNWGYDGVFPFAVQDSYGGAKGLKHLVETAHQKGIAVILDVVYNHLGPEGNYLADFGPYFTDKYNTPWGKAINFDDAWCDGVRRYFIENVLMWFRDFHIDALRLDAVHAIKDFSPVHILKEIKLHVDELNKQTGRDHYFIAELDLNDTRFINPVEQAGYGMDAQWIDEFHHALRVSSGNERTGYYADFEGLSHLAKSYKDAYVYDGIYSPHRHRYFGVKAENNPGKQFVVFSQNHDQVGNRMLGERTTELVSYEMRKLMAAAVISSPYLPMLFMGEEYSETNPFLYFVSHTDPGLVEAVRKGRKAEFAAFHEKGEAPDPQSEETFNKSKLQWDLLQKEPHKVMFEYYKKLIELRKTVPALKELNRKNLEVKEDEQKQIITLHRWNGDQNVIAFMNFSKEKQEVHLPELNKNWGKLIDSADTKWHGPSAAADTVSDSSTLTLQPESFLMYASI